MILDPDSYLPATTWQTQEAVQELAKTFEQQTGLALKLRAGVRSCALQNSLYAQGRTTAGPIVTDAQGCNSWHVVGRAIDADPADPSSGAIITDQSNYTLLGSLWTNLGGVWGGTFTSLGDFGHFEFHPGLQIEDICPDPASCTEFPIDNTAPPLWPWVLGSVLIVGTAAWFLLGDRR